jgi:inosine-uridine nucleoside N-ribohydrolase
MSRKVIIDTDPGIDDALAIQFAFNSDKLDVLGLTTTYGNVSVEQATQNALILTDIADNDVPVFSGADKPLEIDLAPFPDFVHGKNGFGDANFEKSDKKVENKTAVDFIIESVKKHPKEITIIALGPLTNLANVLTRDPDIVDSVAEIILMGGAIKEYGNVSPVAEANILSDPHAADMVFNANWKVTMVGLDVTSKVLLTQDILDRIEQANPKQGKFINQIKQYYLNYYLKELGITGCYVHDSSAVAYAIAPELFEIERGRIRVSKTGVGIGQTIFAPQNSKFPMPFWNDSPVQNACMKVNSTNLLNLLERTLTQK